MARADGVASGVCYIDTLCGSELCQFEYHSPLCWPQSLEEYLLAGLVEMVNCQPLQFIGVLRMHHQEKRSPHDADSFEVRCSPSNSIKCRCYEVLNILILALLGCSHDVKMIMYMYNNKCDSALQYVTVFVKTWHMGSAHYWRNAHF